MTKKNGSKRRDRINLIFRANELYDVFNKETFKEDFSCNRETFKEHFKEKV